MKVPYIWLEAIVNHLDWQKVSNTENVLMSRYYHSLPRIFLGIECGISVVD